MSKMYLMILFPADNWSFCYWKRVHFIIWRKRLYRCSTSYAFFAIYMIIVGYENIVSNQIMYLNGRERQQVVCVFIGGIVNLILNSLCIVLGIFSAKVAITTTIIANFVLVICEYVYVRKT